MDQSKLVLSSGPFPDAPLTSRLGEESMAANIHPTAIVDPQVKLGEGVSIGAYAIVSGDVTLGPGTKIQEHCVIRGSTIIGSNCNIGPAAYVGMDPQHLRFTADPANPSYLVIGNNVIIREGGRIHRATKPGIENATRVGDDCFLMGAIHVAHDCVLESHVIMADGALLGGHCHIGQRAFLGGGCTMHQFVRVGRLVIIAGNEASSLDVPPFAAMRYGRLKGYNAVGCRRAGMSREAITAIRAAYHCLQEHRVMSAGVAAIRSQVPDLPEIREILAFIGESKRGILPAYNRNKIASEQNDSDD